MPGVLGATRLEGETMTSTLWEFDFNGAPPALLVGNDVTTVGTQAAWAIFSRDSRHRYLLGRLWEPEYPWLVVGMINPSSAGIENDQTIRRLLGFARRDCFGGLLVWNPCSLISTDPKALTAAADRVGPRNNEAIENAVRCPMLAKCVVASGNPPSVTVARDIRLARSLAANRRPLWQFGTLTNQGYPRHPVRLAKNTPIVKAT